MSEPATTGGKPDPFSRAEQERRGHRIEWNEGWQYTHVWVFARDYPDGWPGRDTPPEGAGWELNTEMGEDGFKVQDGASGRMYVSHWRRKVTLRGPRPIGSVRGGV